MLDELIAQTEKLQRARGDEIEALHRLSQLTRADLQRDIGEAGLAFVDQRTAEILTKGKFMGIVSLHVLQAALRDAWKAGRLQVLTELSEEGPE